MANVSGVRMNGLASAGAYADCPPPARALFSTAPHAAAAGDQITGWGTLVRDSGQSSSSSCSPSPDDTLLMRRKLHLPSTLASFDLLNVAARSFNRSSFSGDDATSTTVQLPGASLLSLEFFD